MMMILLVVYRYSFRRYSYAHPDGNDEDDNDDFDYGSQDAGPLRWMWSHMTIMMMILKMLLLTNDHNDPTGCRPSGVVAFSSASSPWPVSARLSTWPRLMPLGDHLHNYHHPPPPHYQ